MEIAFPGSEHEFHLPPERIGRADGSGGPDGTWNIRDKEIPRQQREVEVRRSVAPFPSGGAGFASPLVDHRLWDPCRNEPHGQPFACPQINGMLDEGT